MEEIGKRRLAAAGAVAAGLVYFLVCAFPLHKELVLVPAWTRSLPEIASVAAPGTASVAAPQAVSTAAKPASAPKKGGGEPMPFRLGDRYGYFTSDGTILFAASADYGVALAPDAYATYDRLSEGFTIKSPDGSELARVSAIGYPFFAAGRRFVIGPDQSTVSELAANGTLRWSYQLPSIATAFDASPGLAVFGLMDGSLVGLDASGAAVLDFAPGGSRIAGVYGVAVSPDGLLVAAITGADKQRLVVLEKRSAAYRVTYHRYLASDYRRPVYMAFTADGSRLAYESPAGIGVFHRASRSETVVSVAATSRLGQTIGNGTFMVFLSGSGYEKRLVCTALPDRRVVDLRFKANLAFAEARGNSIFLGADGAIARMDMQER
jgi:hypothetical protein